MTPSLIGASIGNYRVVAPLGEGGMGAVYLAEHPLIGKRVALKVLHPELASDAEFVQRFFNEARAVNEIGHPNIVDVLDFGNTNGIVYLIMEYLDGRSLAETIKAGPLAPGRAAVIAQQIADALAASHAHGIVHRDLKPDNIFLLSRQVDLVKVLDFGIAKLNGGNLSSARTRTGVVMGTPAYMSPEQCEGRGRIDGRTDVYALGAVLFEMLTGRTPFLGEGVGEMIVQQLTATPPRPSEVNPTVPPALDAIVMCCLEKSPERRFQTMADLRAALGDPVAFATGQPITVEAVPTFIQPPPQVVRPVSTLSSAAAAVMPPSAVETRRRAGLTVGIVSGAAAIALAVGITLAAHRSGEQPGDQQGSAAFRPQPKQATVLPAPVEPPPPQQPPTPQPPAPQLPALPATVTIRVTADAPNATVFVDGLASAQPIVVARGDKPIVVEVKVAGYEDWRRSVVPDVDHDFDASLKKVPAVIRRPPPPPPRDATSSAPTVEEGCKANDPDCLLTPTFKSR